MSEALTAWLTSELERLNWSHGQLAKAAGISRPAVSNTLRGVLPPSCEFCIKVATALDVAPAHVLNLAGILPSEPAPANPGPVSAEILRLVENLPPEKRAQILELLRLVENLPPDKWQQVLEYVKFISR